MSDLAVRVAVVGGCASGKSTLVAALRTHGFDAWSVAQEHSSIADLWRHLEPDRLVVLLASLEAVRRRRRNPKWPEWIWDLQQRRMAQAKANANVLIDTDRLDAEDVLSEVIRLLET